MQTTTTKTESITEVQSFTLVKNLFRASFSSIAYIRGLFGDEYFVPGKIGGTKFKKLQDGNNEEVKKFVAWMEHGVFDALKKKYLELVLLEIYEGPNKEAAKDKPPQNRKLLECFSFGVTYSSEGASFSLSTPSDTLGDTSKPTEAKANIKQETRSVIRTLIELSAKLRPLPSNRVISMKLMYAPGTPASYEPPFFREANSEDVAWFDQRPERITCGNVTTPFHHVSLSVRTVPRDKIPPFPIATPMNDPSNVSPRSITIPGIPEKNIDIDENEPIEPEQCAKKRIPPKKAAAAVQTRGRRAVMEPRNDKQIMKPKPKIAKMNAKKSAVVAVITDSESEPVTRKHNTRASATKAKKTIQAASAKKKTTQSKKNFSSEMQRTNNAPENSEPTTKRSQRNKKVTDVPKVEYVYSDSNDSGSREAPSVWTMSKQTRKTSETEDPLYQYFG